MAVMCYVCMLYVLVAATIIYLLIMMLLCFALWFYHMSRLIVVFSQLERGAVAVLIVALLSLFVLFVNCQSSSKNCSAATCDRSGSQLSPLDF